MTAQDPRVRQVEPVGREDEAWATDDGVWSFERYGDGWCAMRRVNRIRRPSTGNPFSSLNAAIRYEIGDPR